MTSNSSKKSRTGHKTEPQSVVVRTLEQSQAVIYGPKNETTEERIDRWRTIYHAGELPLRMTQRVEKIADWSWGPTPKSGLRRKMAVAA